MCKGLCCRNVAGTAIKSTFSRTHPWTRVLQERDCRAAYSNIFQDRWHIHAWIRGMEARFSEVVLCDRVRDGWMILFQRIQDIIIRSKMRSPSPSIQAVVEYACNRLHIPPKYWNEIIQIADSMIPLFGFRCCHRFVNFIMETAIFNFLKRASFALIFL